MASRARRSTGGAARLAITADSLEYSLIAPRKTERGDSAPVRIIVQNIAASAQEFDHADPDPYDVTVHNSAGEYVWSLRWRTHVMVGTDVLEVLQPGERREYLAYWDQRDTSGVLVPPGDYVITAAFSARTRIDLGPVHLLVTR